jgi:hypothetical protein
MIRDSLIKNRLSSCGLDAAAHAAKAADWLKNSTRIDPTRKAGGSLSLVRDD